MCPKLVKQNNTMQTTEQTATNKQVTAAVNFGSGRYSPLMVESFKDAKAIFGFNDKSAEKLARQIGSDFGAAMANTIASSKIGKALSADGRVTLSEAAKAKVIVTPALTIMRCMAYANDAGKYGFNRNATSWQLDDDTAKVLAGFEVAE